MPKLTLNGKEAFFEQGMTVLQVCEQNGVEIPRFCYHERLEIAGNCRMCLVEIKGGPPKPAASCAMPAGDGMEVWTDTPMVKKAREGVMEFLLINHPLDCPICDQGGECDLQDQAVAFGRGTNRYTENKRAVKDKYIGPLIKTHMTRCIHCTRCIRFIDNVAGTSEIGATGRGENMEVGTFIRNNITSELSGNIIDLCPVGALTSRPYAFKARSWELRHTESIDVHDAVGSNIRIDYRGNEVMRILPRLNEEINEEWLSDKSRFAYDGLKSQRLDRPYIRKKGKLQETSWDKALKHTAKRLKNAKPERIAAIAGDLADVESMLALKDLMTTLGSPHIDCRQEGSVYDISSRANYLFNSRIDGIEKTDALLIVGANPRYDAPMVNTRIRKRVLASDIPVALIGTQADLSYNHNYLGESPDVLNDIENGGHTFCSALKKAKNPMLIVGEAALIRTDASAILNVCAKICDQYGGNRSEWNGFNILHKAASRVGGLDIGFLPGKKGMDVTSMLRAAEDKSLDVVYLLGADEIDVTKLKNTFVIYQGHHGDAGASIADVVLPGAAYTEKNATYVNLEGRVQRTYLAVPPPGDARQDWQIISDLANACDTPLAYDSLRTIRDAMVQTNDVFTTTDAIVPATPLKMNKSSRIYKQPLADTVKNFYMTDAITRASKTMAACTEELWNNSLKETKQAA